MAARDSVDGIRHRLRAATKGRHPVLFAWLRRPRWYGALLSRPATAANRAHFVLIVGFHHCGTTLVQSALRDQGVYTRLPRGSAGHFAKRGESPLDHIQAILREARAAGCRRAMTKTPTNDMSAFTRTVVDIRWLAPSCVVVPCFRDPAAVALSLERRLGGWEADRALANAAVHHEVSGAWLRYVGRRPSRCVPVSLEDFTRDPARHLRSILALAPGDPLPHPVRTSTRSEREEDGWLPDRRMHLERRHAQTNAPVYRVGRDDWMRTADPAFLPVLREIRRRYGTSPRFNRPA